MTFDEAFAQLEVTVREHGAAIEDLLARLRAGEISRERLCPSSVRSRKHSSESWRNSHVRPKAVPLLQLRH
jgi:hypothetical protein